MVVNTRSDARRIWEPNPTAVYPKSRSGPVMALESTAVSHFRLCIDWLNGIAKGDDGVD